MENEPIKYKKTYTNYYKNYYRKRYNEDTEYRSKKKEQSCNYYHDVIKKRDQLRNNYKQKQEQEQEQEQVQAPYVGSAE